MCKGFGLLFTPFPQILQTYRRSVSYLILNIVSRDIFFYFADRNIFLICHRYWYRRHVHPPIRNGGRLSHHRGARGHTNREENVFRPEAQWRSHYYHLHHRLLGVRYWSFIKVSVRPKLLPVYRYVLRNEVVPYSSLT